ncbi:3-oxoadipate enol-lactonase [Paracoccus sp. S-4012]|uniref:3-oxoadipate enol-lactonase n=1 Tax=Paracoccus sp. S-4012 TaxID=2665648 RepID=UPI0012AFE530|nr:3-oxoadipate enol-lactonase [Paracoccus sp. S-4012]MRX50219.1 3-oxoadipate enol-lactonase [Paracoccus sp. S-4012]
MRVLTRPWGALHYRVDGPATGPALLLVNSLGTDLRLWEPVLPHLPDAWRIIRYDKPGHGLSDRGRPKTEDDLAADAIALIEAEAPQGAVVAGVSIGGLVAQTAAALRPDLVRAVVLSNTALTFGDPATWEERIAKLEAGGMEALVDGVMERWFGHAFRATPELALWRNMLRACQPEGYADCCRVLSQADRTHASAGLTLPVLTVGGSDDQSTTPAIVRKLHHAIPGARWAEVDGAGHLPMVERPEAWAEAVIPFLQTHMG